MKNFTFADAKPWAGHLGISVQDRSELIYSPLVWHMLGLQQTASGYGKKLVNPYKISFEGKKYRLYTTVYSNNGSTWFKVKGQKIFVN